MQQAMVQFLANFGLYNLIKWREAVHIFHYEMGEIFAWIYHNLGFFFKEIDTYIPNWYQLVLQQLYLINTLMLEGFNLNMIWKSLKNTNM